MAFIRTMPVDGAEGAVADMYEGDRAAMGYVPNFTRGFSHRPGVYDAWRDLAGAMKENMDERRYELATIAAARRLRSSYCTLVHGRLLSERFLGPGSVRDIFSGGESGGSRRWTSRSWTSPRRSPPTRPRSRAPTSTGCAGWACPTPRSSTSSRPPRTRVLLEGAGRARRRARHPYEALDPACGTRSWWAGRSPRLRLRSSRAGPARSPRTTVVASMRAGAPSARPGSRPPPPGARSRRTRDQVVQEGDADPDVAVPVRATLWPIRTRSTYRQVAGSTCIGPHAAGRREDARRGSPTPARRRRGRGGVDAVVGGPVAR